MAKRATKAAEIEPTIEPETVAPPVTEPDPVSTAEIPHNISDVVEKAIDSIPPVSEGMESEPQSFAANQPNSATENPGGTVGVFDPSIHATDMFGNPKRNVDGSFAQKRGRKPGSGGGGSTTVRANVVDGETIKRRAAASACVAMLTTAGVMVFGSEWTPVLDKQAGIDERANLTQAFDDYFLATGTIDIPPSIALSLACFAYAAPRFTMPETQKRVGIIIKKIRERRSGKPIGEVDAVPSEN